MHSIAPGILHVYNFSKGLGVGFGKLFTYYSILLFSHIEPIILELFSTRKSLRTVKCDVCESESDVKMILGSHVVSTW